MTYDKMKHYRALELDKVLSILGGMTHCPDSSQMVSELLPCQELEEACLLQAQTTAAFELSMKYGSPSFGGLKNLSVSLARAKAGAALAMKELLEVASVLRVIRSLASWRDRWETDAPAALEAQFSALRANKYLEDQINSAIISEEEMADDASPALADIRRKIRGANQNIRQQLERMIRSTTYQKYLQEPIITMRGGRFVVPVKAENRSEIPGMIHDTSSSGATVFVEPAAVVEQNNEIKVLASREEAEIERVLQELSTEVGNFADAIGESYRMAVELDVIFAKASLGIRMKAYPPRLTDSRVIRLDKARHPLIDPAKVVPVTIRLGDDFDVLVITGPNTGGKTVALKTLGLLTLMALCGLMIPAGEESVVSVFDNVLADIGDEQSIEQSLSTFSAHMTNIISILDHVDNSSLVLLDELGAGTDPVEGAALAEAILERLKLMGAKAAATTHYAEIKTYAINTPRVENASCEFDVASLRPTYRLLIGIPGRSNAFAISQRLGIDDSIVERAKQLVSGESRRFEDIMRNLELSRQQMERDKSQVTAELLAARQAREGTEKERQALRDRVEKELERARVEGRRLIEIARGETGKIMEELEDLRSLKDSEDFSKLVAQSKSDIRGKLNQLDRAVNPVSAGRAEEIRHERPLKPGDTVILVELDQKASVLSAPDKSGNVIVQAGIIKTKVHQTKLKLVGDSEKMPKNRNYPGRAGGSRLSSPVKTELDLRGYNVEEGILEVDRFLDDALLSGLHEVTIIHGRGTGVLRSGIHQHLRGNKCVASYRLGRYGEGEDGVTVVELK